MDTLWTLAASFEVEINGVLVFSKMEKKGFPVFDEVRLFVLKLIMSLTISWNIVPLRIVVHFTILLEFS